MNIKVRFFLMSRNIIKVLFINLENHVINCSATNDIASLVAQIVKHLSAMQETLVQSLGWEDFPGEGNDSPLQYSCLENHMEGRACKATVQGITKNLTRWSNFTFTFANNIWFAKQWIPLYDSMCRKKMHLFGHNFKMSVKNIMVSSWIFSYIS